MLISAVSLVVDNDLLPPTRNQVVVELYSFYTPLLIWIRTYK